MKNKWDALFDSCPGADYGNPPTDTMLGNIAVHPTYLVQAIRYIRASRNFWLTDAPAVVMPDNCISLKIAQRTR